MSLMCKMNGSCSTTKGLCIHEKMMMVMVIIAGIAGVGHFAFHWF